MHQAETLRDSGCIDQREKTESLRFGFLEISDQIERKLRRSGVSVAPMYRGKSASPPKRLFLVTDADCRIDRDID